MLFRIDGENLGRRGGCAPSDPTMVSVLAEALRDRVGPCLYVSSCAVYKNFEKLRLGENARVREYHGGVPNYSDGKAESERRDWQPHHLRVC